MISEVVTLAFDPETANEEIREVFSNDLARTLWLAVKHSHIVSDRFNRRCLFYAEQIKRMKKERVEITAESMLRLLSGWAPVDGIIGTREIDFARELLPFINGEKTIRYEVKMEGKTGEKLSRNV